MDAALGAKVCQLVVAWSTWRFKQCVKQSCAEGADAITSGADLDEPETATSHLGVNLRSRPVAERRHRYE